MTITPAPLSTNNIYKIAGRPFPRIYMTDQGKALKEAYQLQLMREWGKPMMTEVGLKIEIAIFYGDLRTHDIDNGNKILLDAMTGIVFEDDGQIKELHLSKHFDKKKPRVEIMIL